MTQLFVGQWAIGLVFVLLRVLEKGDHCFSDFRFRWLINLILIGISGYFIVTQILAGRWVILLVMLGVGIGMFVLLRAWQRH